MFQFTATIKTATFDQIQQFSSEHEVAVTKISDSAYQFLSLSYDCILEAFEQLKPNTTSDITEI